MTLIQTSQYKPNPLAAILALLIFTAAGVATANTPPQKMTAEEVVAKHLAAIGKAEDLAAAKTRVMTGLDTARLKFASTMREVGGPAQFASDGEKVLLAMVFNSTNYPYEKVAYDGQRLTVAGLPEGGRSPLANFLMAQDIVFKHGLIGGALSSAWPLANLDPDKAKLSYGGTDKIDGRLVHKLKYEPKKGDLKVNFFFDAETFHHLRSEYQYSISARMGARPSSGPFGANTSGQSISRYKLTEDFSDFKPMGKLTLPGKYKLQLVVEAAGQNLDYAISFSEFAFDQSIPANAFNVASPSDDK